MAVVQYSMLGHHSSNISNQSFDNRCKEQVGYLSFLKQIVILVLSHPIPQLHKASQFAFNFSLLVTSVFRRGLLWKLKSSGYPLPSLLSLPTLTKVSSIHRILISTSTLLTEVLVVICTLMTLLKVSEALEGECFLYGISEGCPLHLEYSANCVVLDVSLAAVFVCQIKL